MGQDAVRPYLDNCVNLQSSLLKDKLGLGQSQSGDEGSREPNVLVEDIKRAWFG